MSEKYSQYSKGPCHYSSSGWNHGKYNQSQVEYQKDHNRSVRVVAVIFLVIAVSALLNLDYANVMIRFVDMLLSVWKGM